MEWRERAADCFAIVICGALLALLVRPFQNLPFVDDWAYAWSVERLLRQGDLRILEWSTSANFAQVLWGALFCLPYGFSFSALRLSTAVLAIGGLCAFYLLLRELDVCRRRALVGTATLGLNPIFFVLCWTFMTDVPFLAVMIVCTAATARAIRRESIGWLVTATFFGCTALAVRNVAIAIPAAMAATLILDRRIGGRLRSFALVTVVPLLFLGAVLWWAHGHTERTVDLSGLRDAPATRLQNLRYALPLLPASLLVELIAVTNVLGPALLPLSIPCASWKLLPRILVFGAVLGGSFVAAGMMALPVKSPLSNGSMWSLSELGLTAAMVPEFEPPAPPRSWPPASMAIAALSFAIFLARLCVRKRLDPRETVLVCLAAAHIALVAVLWLTYDRYLIVLLPLGIALLLRSTPEVRATAPALLLLPFAVASLVGLHDHLSCNRAIWDGVEVLRRAGARDSEIDGGYVVNGWLQYAHPENAPRDEHGNIFVPHLTNEVGLRFRISARRLPGWRVIETIPVRRWIGAAEELYALEEIRKSSAPETQPSEALVVPTKGGSSDESQ